MHPCSALVASPDLTAGRVGAGLHGVCGRHGSTALLPQMLGVYCLLPRPHTVTHSDLATRSENKGFMGLGSACQRLGKVGAMV